MDDDERVAAEKRAIWRAIRELLGRRGDDGRKTWSLLRIGSKIGLSPETVRRASVSPVGSTQALRATIPGLMGMTMDELVERFGHEEAEDDPINSALLELVYENPAKAEVYTRAAMSLRQQHKPENMTRSGSRSLILAHVADEKNKSLPHRSADLEDITSTGMRAASQETPKRSKGKS